MAWTCTEYVLKRADLYAEVWSEPVERVASKYGISGPGLLKICRRLRIPVPPRGFWAKKTARKKVRQPTLPAAREGDPVEHRLSVRQNSLDAAPRSSEVECAIERELMPDALITVPAELSDPHPLVAKSQSALTKAGLKAKDVLWKRRCIDVVVSREHVPRALRIVDALLKAFEARGNKVEVTAPVPPPEGYVPRDERSRYKPSKTGVHIGDVFIEFRIEEDLEPERLRPPWPRLSASVDAYFKARREHPGPEFERRSTGRLSLAITSHEYLYPPRRIWRDGKRANLEELLNDFVTGVLELADRNRRWEEERAREEQKWRDAERRRAEEERLRRLEERRVLDLDRRVAAWRTAKEIHDLLQAVEASGARSDDVSAWVEWARARAAELRAGALDAPVLLDDRSSDEDP